jgi:hypothetical protein
VRYLLIVIWRLPCLTGAFATIMTFEDKNNDVDENDQDLYRDFTLYSSPKVVASYLTSMANYRNYLNCRSFRFHP